MENNFFLRDWQVKSAIKAKIKGLYEFKNIRPWKGPHGKQELVRFEDPYNGVSEFNKDIKQLLVSISSSSIQRKTVFAMDWIPSAKYFSNSPFALFLPRILVKNYEEEFGETNLIHGFYGKYAILSSGFDFDLYSSAIDFFYRFRFLIPRSRANKPLLLRDITGMGGNRSFLLFSSTNGNGLLIKVLDKQYGGGINKELDIMRIGKIIGANIPRNAAVIHNTGSPMFKSLGESDFFVQTLTPVVKYFREASAQDLEKIIAQDGVNLGKLFLFGIVCGSWDRHAGNYLISKKIQNYSLQEIDFGLFQPDFFKNDDFVPDDESRQRYPSKQEKLLGWAITRHPKVDKLIKGTDQKKFFQGISSSIRNLYTAISGKKIRLEEIVAPKLFKRIQGLFVQNNQTQKLFFDELLQLEFDIDPFKQLLEKYEI